MKFKLLVVSLLVSLTTTLSAGVHGEWAYSGDADPKHWGDLKPEFFMCRDGKNQSPVDINTKKLVHTDSLKSLSFSYTTGAKEAINNGHTIKVDVTSGSYISLDGIKFELKQFHFHSPSENRIDGRSFPLEAHFVHQSQDGQLAVVAVMYEDGKDNEVLKKVCNTIFSNVHEVHKCNLTTQDINMLLPKNKDYYRFSGSLTTPPCSEGVRWIVLENYLNISKKQSEKFVNVMMKGHNERPVQLLNAIKVLENKLFCFNYDYCYLKKIDGMI